MIKNKALCTHVRVPVDETFSSTGKNIFDVIVTADMQKQYCKEHIEQFLTLIKADSKYIL